ncbi:chymotrypsin-1-like [Epargyreus clarus]|uniref:chymotrypsin-1-like n=1 Tax=Epargyreus clarus TaxID=520877 RepID=UPI003C2DF17E
MAGNGKCQGRFCHLKDLGEVTVNWTVVLHDLEKRIVGGTPTTLNQYPFNVQFFNFGGLCGGSILTSKVVLTAAHCFDHNTNIAEMRVISNSRYIFDPEASSHEVWDYVLHEHYNDTIAFSNDIAIIIIHGAFLFGHRVQRAVIGNSDVWMRENETFVATGWGQIKYNGNLSQQGLMRTHLNYVVKDKCMEENRVVLSPDMFCLHGDGVRDTCRGDSGGGVLWNEMVVGIVSHGKGCAAAPSMYVNVYYFIPWINKTVERLYKQFCHFHNYGQ